MSKDGHTVIRDDGYAVLDNTGAAILFDGESLAPCCCGGCVKSEFYICSTTPGTSIVDLVSEDNGNNTVTHTFNLQCNEDGAQLPFSFTFSCDEVECIELYHEGFGACDSGTIKAGNDPVCCDGTPDPGCKFALGLRVCDINDFNEFGEGLFFSVGQTWTSDQIYKLTLPLDGYTDPCFTYTFLLTAKQYFGEAPNQIERWDYRISFDTANYPTIDSWFEVNCDGTVTLPTGPTGDPPETDAGQVHTFEVVKNNNKPATTFDISVGLYFPNPFKPPTGPACYIDGAVFPNSQPACECGTFPNQFTVTYTSSAPSDCIQAGGPSGFGDSSATVTWDETIGTNELAAAWRGLKTGVAWDPTVDNVNYWDDYGAGCTPNTIPTTFDVDFIFYRSQSPGASYDLSDSHGTLVLTPTSVTRLVISVRIPLINGTDDVTSDPCVIPASRETLVLDLIGGSPPDCLEWTFTDDDGGSGDPTNCTTGSFPHTYEVS